MDVETVAKDALKTIHGALMEYLPPDGIDAKSCLSRILAVMDGPEIVAMLIGEADGYA